MANKKQAFVFVAYKYNGLELIVIEKVTTTVYRTNVYVAENWAKTKFFAQGFHHVERIK